MSALGCFGRFTLFSPRVSHSNTCRLLSFVCFVLLFGFVALVCFCFLCFASLCFWFLFCKCLGIPNSPRSLDLDDRQGLIARSAMQQKKKKSLPLDTVNTFFCLPSTCMSAPRFTVNLARFTKTRDCISCFGSTISGMRLFTKSWICIAQALHPGTIVKNRFLRCSSLL